MIQQTSLIAYEEFVEEHLGERQQITFDLIRRNPGRTALELAKSQGRDSNWIRPRITELYKMGRIRIVGERDCEVSGRKAFVWRVN